MEDLKEKINFINIELETLKKIFHSNSNIDKETYILNLSDISQNDLEYAFNKIKTSPLKYFPSIFEIRKIALAKEARIVLKFLQKVQEQIINNNIEFKHNRIKNLLKENGGWDSFKKRISNFNEEEFINLYSSVS